ncbi:uncharacterized protein [Parasteatoda tepidariorum]|uniref:uncharacterized protein isoform X2 n=1 Tax=Parasteatoda tepidariorum TaxID=114398 RepID=UPI00077FCCAF|nr:uncharacterized protein LOC107436324 [Parasteatoda tepidariorum]
MPSYCCAFGCNNSSARSECLEKGISFHKFPLENKDLLKIWLSALKRANFKPNIHSKICSEHFTPDSFDIQNFSNRRFIKESAVPSIFKFNFKKPPRVQSSDPTVLRELSSFCSAPGCNNFSKRKECLEKNVTFHPFPLKNEFLLKFWLVQMDMIDFKPDSTSFLCSEHFEEDCFSYHKISGKKALEKDAVPTKFRSKSTIEKPDPPGVCTEPTVLRITEAKKRKYVECDDDFDFNRSSVTIPECIDASVQTAVSGVSTQLLLQASSSEYSTVFLGSKDAGMQTRMDGISALLIENTSLQKELTELKAKVDRLTFRVEGIKDDSLMKSLSGFSAELFKAIYDYLFLEKHLTTYSNISPYNQFFAFLIYLRTGISQFFLSILFKIGQPSTSRILSNVSSFMYNRIRPIKIWPSREQINRKSSPIFFRHYPNCRVILETVELQIQRPTSVQTQRLTFSTKKNTYTIKGLVGKTPTGGISFISDVWPGSISERDLFLKSGILDCLEKNDLVIADKSFDIREELEEKGCFLCTPKFLTDRISFSHEEQLLYPNATHHRIHYDLATSKFNKFKFFDGQISTMTFDIVNEYFYIIGFLINFGKPLIHIRQH